MKLRTKLLTAVSSMSFACAPALAINHIFETPDTCGRNGSARISNYGGNLVVSACAGSDGLAGFVVTGIRGVNVAPFSFSTTNCQSVRIVVSGYGSTKNSSFIVTIDGDFCHSNHEVPGLSVNPVAGHSGITQITLDIAELFAVAKPSFKPTQFNNIFIGTDNCTISGNFLLSGHPATHAIPDLHFTDINNCSFEESGAASVSTTSTQNGLVNIQTWQD